jgi:protein-S-isoprenylcysteine O-methyltransferase Ste14
LPWQQAVGIPLNVVLFVALMVLGWGDARGFFAHPARAGAALVLVLMAPVMTLCTAGRSRGVKHAPDWKPFFPMLVAHSLFTAYVMPWMDARDVLVLPGGDALRWTGLALLALGALLRLGPMVDLGRRFSSQVAIQAEHRLHTSGWYSSVRHPSYLGILLMDLGFAGLFRSTVALALMPIVFWMFKRRMDVEEGLLIDQFGDEYRAYMGRTARIVPRVY